MYPLRPGIKINQLVVHFPVTISTILYHWSWRGPVVLLIFSSCELRRLILVPSCFIMIKRLSLFLCTDRFVSWKLNKTIKQIMFNSEGFLHIWYKTQNTSIPRDKPQFSASKGDICHGFFYHQHALSYHIASRANYHLSRSKRKLHVHFKRRGEIPLKNFKNPCPVKKKKCQQRQDCIPGAFSHMSHRGTSLGSASPTRTCRLASLLHIWTCNSSTKNRNPFA